MTVERRRRTLRLALLIVLRHQRTVVHLLPGLTFRRLATPERFGNQCVGKEEFGLGHVLDRQHNLVVFSGGGIATANARCLPFYAQQQSTEPLAAIDRDRHLYLELVAGKALEVRTPHQRAVHAGRRHFKPIGTVDRVRHVEHRRERPRDCLAILHLHRTVRPFGHDLNGTAIESRHLHPDKLVTAADQDRLNDRSHAGRDSLLHDKAWIGIRPKSVDRLRHCPFGCTSSSSNVTPVRPGT